MGWLFDNFDSKIIAVTESAIFTPEEECLVEVVHDQAQTQLGYLQLVHYHWIFVDDIYYRNGGNVLPNQQQYCQLNHTSKFVIHNILYMILLNFSFVE